MKVRTNAVVTYQLAERYEKIREEILASPASEYLDRPLAHWAMSTDRRLPLAFMPFPVREILSTSFDDLFSAAGIGQKKIGMLIELLARVARSQATATAPVVAPLPEATDDPLAEGAVDVGSVSEELWEQWRATVVRNNLQHQTLGRFAPTLKNVPRVIWETPLENYVSLTLAEIRQMKTYGEKRVSCIIEIFGELHRMLAPFERHPHLSFRVVPRIVDDLIAWIHDVTDHAPRPVTKEELRQGIVEPLLAQVSHDAGDQVASLTADRLDLDGSSASVRLTARKMGLTRARVYQLIGESSAVLSVRWPSARARFTGLRQSLELQESPADCLELLDRTIELFMPERSVDEIRAVVHGRQFEPSSPEETAAEKSVRSAMALEDARSFSPLSRREGERNGGMDGRSARNSERRNADRRVLLPR